MTENKEKIRALKFFLFSVSAGIVELGAFTLCNEVFKLPYWTSYLIGLVLSVLWNFTFNKKFTFKSAENVPKAMALVFAFYVVFTPLSTLLEHYLTNLEWNEYLVTLINMVLNLILEYFYDRYVVYRKSVDTAESGKKTT